jgi:hypothetical protein
MRELLYPCGVPRALAHLVALSLALGLAGHAAAQSAARVLVLGPTPSELLTRVRGQTSDLPFELVELDRADATRDPFERAIAVGTAEHAPFALSFDLAEHHVDVRIVEVRAGRLFVRRVPIERASDRSAALEAAALVVRSALSALAEGGHVGIVVPRAEPPPEAPSVPTSLPPPSSADPRAHFELGWAGAVDGHAPLGQHAAVLRGGLALGPVRVLAAFAPGIPVALEDERARLDVTRLRAALGAFVRAVDASPIHLILGLELGAVLWHRATTVRTDTLVATAPTWSASPLVSAHARVELALARAVALALDVGVDVLPLAPSFTLGAQPRYPLWSAQPLAELVLVVQAE